MPTKKSYRVDRTHLNKQVYDILKNMIADRRFVPGSSLNVEQLTQELGVSRTPIWEAIRRLEHEGLVRQTPHKSVRVVELTRKTAIELYEVRKTMEAMAVRLGAENATLAIIQRMEQLLDRQKSIIEADDSVGYSRSDHEFHMLICQAGGNDLLTELVEGLRYKALPLAFKLSPHFNEFYQYHRQILAAFQNRDTDAAETAMNGHNDLMLNFIRTSPWDDKADADTNA